MMIHNGKSIAKILRGNRAISKIIRAGQYIWQSVKYLFGYEIGGNAEVKDGKILGVGDEFAWNQHSQPSDITAMGNLVRAYDEQTHTIRFTYPSGTGSYNFGIRYSGVSGVPIGHKLLIYLAYRTNIASDLSLVQNGVWGNTRVSQYGDVGDARYHIRIAEVLDPNRGQFFICHNGTAISEGQYDDILSFDYIDLTAIEQAMGITINSLEDFKTYLKSHSMMDKDATEIPYFGYDAGSVKTSLPIVASNQSGSESTTYPLLVSSPLYKVGSVADVAKFGEGVTRKMGKVKLKDLSWTYRVSAATFYAVVPNMPVRPKGRPSIIMAVGYDVLSYNDTNNPSRPDMSMWCNSIAESGNGSIIMKNSAYTNAESFKAHFTDEDILIYELATPTTEAVDLPKIVDYQPTILTTDTQVVGDITIEE